MKKYFQSLVPPDNTVLKLSQSSKKPYGQPTVHRGGHGEVLFKTVPLSPMVVNVNV
jgi:hypothetical protein